MSVKLSFLLLVFLSPAAAEQKPTAVPTFESLGLYYDRAPAPPLRSCSPRNEPTSSRYGHQRLNRKAVRYLIFGRTNEWYSNRSIKRLTHYVERDKQDAKAQKEPVAQPVSHKDFLTDEEITGLRR